MPAFITLILMAAVLVALSELAKFLLRRWSNISAEDIHRFRWPLRLGLVLLAVVAGYLVG